MVDVWGWFADPLEFEFMRRALLAVALVAVVSAVVGAFVVVRGMAFIGDALAHASFAGVAAAFALGFSIYLGAVVAAIATALGIAFISQRGRLRFDTAIGVLFVGAFALGIVIVSRQENYTVDLFSFVFGNVLGVSWGDLLLMAAIGALVVALVAIFAGIGLVIGQNRHLHRRPIGPKQMAMIFLGGIVTGAAAGAASQGLFYALSGANEIVAMGRVASWTVLGLGVGFGIGGFVPNLHRHRAAIAGAVVLAKRRV